MKRSGPPKRKTPLRSEKSDYQLEYESMIPMVKVRSNGRCEILAAHDCDGMATDHPHHRKMRSQGGTNTMTNLLDVCWTGHQWIHTGISRDEAEACHLLLKQSTPEYPYKMRDQ